MAVVISVVFSRLAALSTSVCYADGGWRGNRLYWSYLLLLLVTCFWIQGASQHLAQRATGPAQLRVRPFIIRDEYSRVPIRKSRSTCITKIPASSITPWYTIAFQCHMRSYEDEDMSRQVQCYEHIFQLPHTVHASQSILETSSSYCVACHVRIVGPTDL